MERVGSLRGRPIQKVALNQHVVNAIIDSIRDGDMHLGDKLPSESQLCEQFNVGRHVIREALRRLQELAIVRTEVGMGTYICSEPPSTLGPQALSLLLLGDITSDTLYEFRMAMETFAARLAAEKATQADLAELRDSLETMYLTKGREEDAEDFLKANHNFHIALIKASHNQLYVVLYNTMNDLLNQLLHSISYSIVSSCKSYEEHKQIYDAIQLRNADLAGDCALAHLKRVRGEKHRNLSVDASTIHGSAE